MVASFKIDIGLGPEGDIHHGGYTIPRTDGRNRTHRAVAEEIVQIMIGGDRQPPVQCGAQKLEIRFVVRRHDREYIAIGILEQHGPGELLGGNSRSFRRLSGRMPGPVPKDPEVDLLERKGVTHGGRDTHPLQSSRFARHIIDAEAVSTKPIGNSPEPGQSTDLMAKSRTRRFQIR